MEFRGGGWSGGLWKELSWTKPRSGLWGLNERVNLGYAVERKNARLQLRVAREGQRRIGPWVGEIQLAMSKWPQSSTVRRGPALMAEDSMTVNE